MTYSESDPGSGGDIERERDVLRASVLRLLSRHKPKSVQNLIRCERHTPTWGGNLETFQDCAGGALGDPMCKYERVLICSNVACYPEWPCEVVAAIGAEAVALVRDTGTVDALPGSNWIGDLVLSASGSSVGTERLSQLVAAQTAMGQVWADKPDDARATLQQLRPERLAALSSAARSLASLIDEIGTDQAPEDRT